ncbi:uncharacterized protein LOC134814146 [Bolinopsis microptera]|uniref:uncharacterized protein LOC134814146 n=1 Tax=Bolinopsis microptera TaxID=2820187 RepID=UPI0030799EEF
MLSDGLFRGVHIYKGCSRHSSLKEWLSPTSSCDLRSIRREVESFPNDISELPKKVGNFVEVKSTALEYMRKVRCFLTSTHFIVAKEKIWKSAKETHPYEVDAILKLSDYTFYFSGEILVVENRLQSGSHLCRYFELCDDSSVNIWKLLFRQCGCLGPDTAEDDGSDLEPRNTFVISDDGLIDSDELPCALSPPAFFVIPPPYQSKSGQSSSSMLSDINNTLDRSGQGDLMLSKHLCCSESCLLDIAHGEVRHSKRRRVSSCTAFTWNNKLVATVEKSSIKKKEKALKSVSLSFSRKGKRTTCKRRSKDDSVVPILSQYPQSPMSKFQSGLQLSVYNIKPEHFAQQLTFLDQRYLLAMSPRELLYCEKINDDKVSHKLPNIREAVTFFNHVSMLVVQLILHETTPRARARLIRYLITVSEKLRQQNNYSSLRAIIAGLQSNPIYRLEKSWKLIKGQSRKTFNNLVEIWKHTNNYENYQNLLEKGLQRGFIVPFLGLFFNQVLMTSLIFKELNIPELELYPEELEGPWRDSFVQVPEGGCSSTDPLVIATAADSDTDDSVDVALDSICLSPCFPATPSSFSRKLKRLRKKPLHAGEVGLLPGVEEVLGPVTRAIAEQHPRTKVLQIQYLPPYLLRRYQLAASVDKLTDRPAVHYFIFKDKLLGEEELRALSLQRES